MSKLVAAWGRAHLDKAALLLTLVSAVPEASAECFGNATIGPEALSQVFLATACTLPDGRPGHGTSTCDTDDQGVMVCEPSVPIRSDGTATPKYMILSVLYAPPGSKGCAKPGEVTYMDSRSLGTSLSVSSSNSEETKLSASLSVGTPVANASFEASTMDNRSEGSSNEMELKRSSSSTTSVRGSCLTDGIDHHQDVLWIVLHPEVNVTTFEAAGCKDDCAGDAASWSFGNGGEFLAVRVGELLQSAGVIQGDQPVDARVQDALDRHGITWVEKVALTEADPFANLGNDERTTPDPSRFARIEGGFPYRQDDGGSQSMREYTMGTEDVHKTGQTASHTYGSAVSFSGGASFSEFVSVKLGFSESWTWTNSNASTNASTTSSNAHFSIGVPSSEWTGPISYAAYYDTIFNTYAFLPD